VKKLLVFCLLLVSSFLLHAQNSMSSRLLVPTEQVQYSNRRFSFFYLARATYHRYVVLKAINNIAKRIGYFFSLLLVRSQLPQQLHYQAFNLLSWYWLMHVFLHWQALKKFFYLLPQVHVETASIPVTTPL